MLHMYEATLVGIHLFVSSKNLEHLFLYTSDCYLLFLESSGIISHIWPVELLEIDKNKTMGKSRKVGGGIRYIPTGYN